MMGTYDRRSLYDRRASQGIVVREIYVSPSGKKQESYASTYDDFAKLSRPGHFYRGMAEAEWNYIRSHGHIKSDNRFCVKGEGTCFDKSLDSAEGYTNYGHTNPLRTGRPNYVVEVSTKALTEDKRDGYWKTMDDEASIPKSEITRAWKFVPEGDKLVAYPASI